jgi:hypothetical protein
MGDVAGLRDPRHEQRLAPPPNTASRWLGMSVRLFVDRRRHMD